MTPFNLPKRLREEADLISKSELGEIETALLLEEAADELEAMRPTFDQLKARYDRHAGWLEWQDELRAQLAEAQAKTKWIEEEMKLTLHELHEKYYELVYCVASKFPNESRHETALRYIRNAEAYSGSVDGQCERKPK
jgi:hypothetical protein